MSRSTPDDLVCLADAVPADHMVRDAFKAYYNAQQVIVTAVLERTAVVVIDGEKVLLNKHLIFVEKGFRLAEVDPAKAGQRQRAYRGWLTNHKRLKALRDSRTA